MLKTTFQFVLSSKDISASIIKTTCPMKFGIVFKRLPLFLFFFCIFFFSPACFSLDPQRFDSPYYREGRFRNFDPDEELVSKSLFTVMKWKLFGEKGPPSVNLPIEELEKPPPVKKLKTKNLLAPPNTVRMIWLGHATVWIAAYKNGKRVHLITDPIFEGISLAHDRLIEFPIPPKKLPPIHAVLVSHCHRDHLDLQSLQFIQKENPQVQIFLPNGTRSFAKEEGLGGAEVIEWWQSQKLSDTANYAQIEFTPSQHWSRMGLFDMMQSHWGSYVIELGKQKLYFGGDTAYASHFKKIGQAHPEGFAAAILPIGAFKPRWFMRSSHIDPPEAILAARDLNADMILPIHWGTFSLGDDLPSESILYLKHLLEKQKGKKQKALLWHPGTHLDIKL